MLVPTAPAETPSLDMIQPIINNMPMPAITSEVGRIVDEAKAIVIADNVTYASANSKLAEVRKTTKVLEKWEKPYKDFLNEAKSTLANRVKAFTLPLKQADDILESAILKYKRQMEAAAAELRRKAEEEERERRRKAEEEAAAAAAAAMPWEDVPAVAPPPVIPSIPIIPVAAVPVVAGVSTRKLPARAEVFDKRAFIEAALKDQTGQMMEFITFDGPALNAEARRMGKQIEVNYPGVKFIQEESLTSR